MRVSVYLDDGIFGANDELRGLMDELSCQTNLGKYVKLPMNAVMGDTSSGKRSLLSALSGVELPSSSKLCTRCPIMLQMRKTDGGTSKKAIVSIQWKSNDQCFPTFDEVVTEDWWGSLPGTIARAQELIIKETSKQVAEDQVIVHITGPSCEDLTLVDLPGIV